eukprot:3254985-Amphidinium_carterae.1
MHEGVVERGVDVSNAEQGLRTMLLLDQTHLTPRGSNRLIPHMGSFYCHWTQVLAKNCLAM